MSASSPAVSAAAPQADVRTLQAFVFGLFFIFGGITSLNDILIPKLKDLFAVFYRRPGGRSRVGLGSAVTAARMAVSLARLYALDDPRRVPVKRAPDLEPGDGNVGGGHRAKPRAFSRRFQGPPPSPCLSKTHSGSMSPQHTASATASMRVRTPSFVAARSR